MRKVAIFMSDFHLGQKTRMEDFHMDNEFAELLGRLSLYHEEDAVDLVLLGDVLDLWTTVSKAEEEHAQTIDDIDLYLPVKPEGSISEAEIKEALKARAIVRNHRDFFEAIGRFLVDNPRKRQVLYIPGNHDHSMVNENLQQILRRAMLTPAVMRFAASKNKRIDRSTLVDRVRFAVFYKDEYLQVYAEHGNQLTYGGVFRYDDDKSQSTFEQFGPECPGYVQFKTISGRALRSAPKLNGMLVGAFNPANWIRLANWLFIRGYFRAFALLQRYHIQFSDSLDSRITWARKKLPAEWKTLLFLIKARFFSATRDEFGDLIPTLFEQNDDPRTMPLCGHKLDPNKFKTVILGHSHGARDVDLPGSYGLKYYNTGSWILLQDEGRELVEQTWVTVSRELPSTILNIGKTAFGASITVVDKFQHAETLKLATPDLLTGIEVGDEVLMEKNHKGEVTSIVQDKPLSRTVIDRQMIRRKVGLGDVANSPGITDGTPLNHLLRSMDLRVGDLILFHWNFGAYLWRIMRTHPFHLFNAIPGVVTGAINRLGTSSYWNHIAMVFGAPSEREESDQYNDPLIIEAVPDQGVSIHTPAHYLEYPNEWNFAILRLKSSMLNTWEARCLLRRNTVGYLGAVYDMETVAKGTLRYAAQAMDAKARSGLAGAVYGAILCVVLCTGAMVWWVCRYVYHNWSAWESEKITLWVQVLRDTLVILLEHFSHWPADIVGAVVKAGEIVVLIPFVGLAVYVAWSLGKLAKNTWLFLTASIGSVVGFCVVPVMADIAEEWTEKSKAERIGFVLIWFSPLLPILAVGTLIPTFSENEWEDVFRRITTLVLFSALITVLSAEALNKIAAPPIKGLGWCFEQINRWLNRVHATLGWRIRGKSPYESPPVQKQFICSGLVQQALAETAQEMMIADIGSVVVHPDWNASQSVAHQSGVFRSTMPKHFALAESKFTWTYLYLDGVLTPDPSASHKAQAFTAPIHAARGELCSSAVRAIKFGFAGAFMTILASTASRDLTAFAPKELCSIDISEVTTKTVVLLLAVTLGIIASFQARRAQKDLAIHPSKRGRALAFYGFVSGGAASAIGLINLAILSGGIPLVNWIVGLALLAGLSSAFLLLF
jgi:UDP-2,3-diacylglucosamine pyrophosphatase LpxH